MGQGHQGRRRQTQLNFCRKGPGNVTQRSAAHYLLEGVLRYRGRRKWLTRSRGIAIICGGRAPAKAAACLWWSDISSSASPRKSRQQRYDPEMPVRRHFPRRRGASAFSGAFTLLARTSSTLISASCPARKSLNMSTNAARDSRGNPRRTRSLARAAAGPIARRTCSPSADNLSRSLRLSYRLTTRSINLRWLSALITRPAVERSRPTNRPRAIWSIPGNSCRARRQPCCDGVTLNSLHSSRNIAAATWWQRFKRNPGRPCKSSRG